MLSTAVGAAECDLGGGGLGGDSGFGDGHELVIQREDLPPWPAKEKPALKAIVVITTDKVYKNREWSWPYRENEELGGRDPYSSSKACAELVCAAYRDELVIRTEGHILHAGPRTLKGDSVRSGGYIPQPYPT